MRLELDIAAGEAAGSQQGQDERRNIPKVAHLVGSSKNIIGGLLTNSRAIDNLFFCPPLRFAVMVRRCSAKPRVSRISWIFGNIYRYNILCYI